MYFNASVIVYWVNEDWLGMYTCNRLIVFLCDQNVLSISRKTRSGDPSTFQRFEKMKLDKTMNAGCTWRSNQPWNTSKNAWSRIFDKLHQDSAVNSHATFTGRGSLYCQVGREQKNASKECELAAVGRTGRELEQILEVAQRAFRGYCQQETWVDRS